MTPENVAHLETVIASQLSRERVPDDRLREESMERHSGAMRSIEPGISRFPDAQLRI
jgi:hypothetical protein